MTNEEAIAAPVASAPDTPAPSSWWGRYYLSIAALIAMPLIYAVFSTVAGGLTPDIQCPLCVASGQPHDPIPPGLNAEDRTRAHVEAVVRQLERNLPKLTSEPIPLSSAPDPEAKPDSAPGLVRLAADVNARYAYAVPAGLLILISIPITISAFRTLPGPPNPWRRISLFTIFISAVFGYLFGDTQPIRLYTAEYLLGKLALSDYPHLTPETWMFAFRVVNTVTVLGMIATAALVVMFAWLAAEHPREDEEKTEATLAERAAYFRLGLMKGSIVLVLAVASTYGLFSWAPVLLPKEVQAPIQSLSSSGSLYWGVIYSLSLVTVSLPAALRLQMEIRTAAKGENRPPAEVASEAGFTFDVRQVLTTVLTLAGPALTGPLLDMVRQVTTAA